MIIDVLITLHVFKNMLLIEFVFVSEYTTEFGGKDQVLEC